MKVIQENAELKKENVKLSNNLRIVSLEGMKMAKTLMETSLSIHNLKDEKLDHETSFKQELDTKNDTLEAMLKNERKDK